MNASKSIPLVLLFVVVLLFQTQAGAQATNQEGNKAKSGLTSCFDYYKFGSVIVDLTPSVSTASAGSPLTFTGKIQNNNTYPIVDGQVYVKIFQKQGSENAIKKNGYPVVDEFIVQEGINIEGKKAKDITFEWNVPAHIPSGDYQLATYFVTDQKFNLSGLSFTDDVTGGTVNFSVSGYAEKIPHFDKGSVTINGRPYSFASPISTVNKEQPITVSAILINDSKEDVIVPVTWMLYAWDAQNEKNKIIEKKVDYVIDAGKKQNVEYTVADTKHPVYLLIAKATYQDTNSFLNIRFGRREIEGVRLNFPSTATYPLVKGEEATVFSCFHSTMSDVVPNGKLELTTEDLSGSVLHSYTYTGDITGDMMGVKDSFIPAKDSSNFVVHAKLYYGNNLVDESRIKYCKENNVFGECLQGVAAVKYQIKNIFYGILALVGVLAILYFVKKRHV